MIDILVPVLTMAVLGLVLSAGLAFAYKRLRVEVDPRVEKISEVLPQVNCGACGFAGCQAFAEGLVKGAAEANGCPVGGESVAKLIADILGVSAGEIIKKTARVHCRGTNEAALSRGAYHGLLTCAASHLIGGDKQCLYGCLSLGDCVRACPFDAMAMGEDGLPIVIVEKCTACGKCVDACPRNIMELHPLAENALVFCRSLDRPQVSRKVCKNACIACGICVRSFPEAVVMENNLAKIVNFRKFDPEKYSEFDKCPTKAIGLIEKILAKKES